MDAFLREQYLLALSQRLADIKSLARQYRVGDKDCEQQIRILAHSLHGSGGSFGFPLITELARTAEFAADTDLITSLTPLAREMRRILNDEKAVKENAPRDKAANVDTKVATGAEPVSQKSHPPAARHVLLIEDDEVFITLIRDSLLAIDPTLNITVSNSGKDAQEKLVANTYALIVMDLMLPDRDGRDILREIKIDFHLPVPVVILSGISRDVVRVECMSLGASKYLNKSIHAEELAYEFEKLLNNSDKLSLTLVPKGNELKKNQPELSPKDKLLKTSTVLVAEDDALQAKLIQQRLTAEGLTVVLAENGRHALQLLRQERYSLVILDVQMPMVSGFEVLEKMRNELDMADVPVIVLSAMGSEADIIKGYNLGANDYILKPYSQVQLVARVKTLLKPRR